VAEFYLSRSVGFHLVQSYLPTILIVVISWVSFWMDVNSVPGRTTLGVTTLLAVSSQSSGEQSTSPCTIHDAIFRVSNFIKLKISLLW
jgi:Neurotransmitter-gated ion-channel transmembrane region